MDDLWATKKLLTVRRAENRKLQHQIDEVMRRTDSLRELMSKVVQDRSIQDPTGEKSSIQGENVNMKH